MGQLGSMHRIIKLCGYLRYVHYVRHVLDDSLAVALTLTTSLPTHLQAAAAALYTAVQQRLAS
jgi:hypothetical protein